MIDVYIWEGLYGHAAIRVRANEGRKEVYISFHPNVPPNKDAGIFQKWAGLTDFFGGGVDARPAKSLDEDIEYIGSRVRKNNPTAIDPGKPKATISLSKLNEDALIEHWYQLLANKVKYAAVLQNCSTVIAQCLAVGWFESRFWFNKSLTNKAEVTRAMESLKSSVITIKTERFGRYINETLYYRYTGETVKEPEVILQANVVGILGYLASIPLVFISLWAALPVALAGFVVITFTQNFGKYAWDPRLVHNIALYLEEQET